MLEDCLRDTRKFYFSICNIYCSSVTCISKEVVISFNLSQLAKWSVFHIFKIYFPSGIQFAYHHYFSSCTFDFYRILIFYYLREWAEVCIGGNLHRSNFAFSKTWKINLPLKKTWKIWILHLQSLWKKITELFLQSEPINGAKERKRIH